MSRRETQMQYYLSHMWILKEAELIEADSITVVVRGWGKWADVAKDYKYLLTC